MKQSRSPDPPHRSPIDANPSVAACGQKGNCKKNQFHSLVSRGFSVTTQEIALNPIACLRSTPKPPARTMKRRHFLTITLTAITGNLA